MLPGFNIDVSGNLPYRAFTRYRTDRALVLDVNVGENYPTPPPLSQVGNPELVRRNVQQMGYDYILNDPGRGYLTHWWHSTHPSRPTWSGDAHPTLLQGHRAAQLGYVRPNGQPFNPTPLRYGSVLTVGEDEIPTIQTYAANPHAAYPQYNQFRRFVR